MSEERPNVGSSFPEERGSQAETAGGSAAASSTERPESELKLGWNPLTIIAVSTMSALFLLIGLALFGRDDGFVSRMSEPEFARGIITYLFAVTTIGVAVIVGLAGLMGASKDQYARGKDVLALLLGVFGTIVGFYFGTATAASVKVPTSA